MAIVVAALLGGFVVSLAPHSGFWAASALLLLGPGYLIERRLVDWELPLLGRATLWLALSLAVIPLGYLWLGAVGLRMSGALGAGLLAGLVGALGWQLWHDLRRLAAPPRIAVAPTLVIVALLALIAWTRTRHIAGLAFPPWVDAIHHALIIRVVRETGQPPFSLRPYLPIDRFAYHWGYHAVAASLWQLTDVTLPELMLWSGQLLGALVALALAGCALTLWRRPVAAYVALLAVGFWSIMPAYYLTWSRYTLLTGLVMLPAAIIAGWQAVAAPTRRSVALLALLLAGLNVTHFVVFCCAGLWCIAAWFSHTGRLVSHRRAAVGLACAVALALLGTLPWIVVLLGTQSGGASAPAGSPLRLVGSSYNAMPYDLLWASDNRRLLALACVAAALALWSRRRGLAAIVLWCFLVMLVANPVWFGLPYLSFFANNIVVLMLFVPVTLALAAGAASVEERAMRWLSGLRWPRAAAAGRLAVAAGLLLWGARSATAFQSVVNDGTVFAKPAELAAVAWVAANTPPDARFAINTAGWLFDVPRGTDAGWWLLPLAGRQTSTPPVIFKYGSPSYIKATQQESLWLRDAAHDLAPDALADWMAARGLSYAYATAEDDHLLTTARLAASPRFVEVYRNEAAAIFKLATP